VWGRNHARVRKIGDTAVLIFLSYAMDSAARLPRKARSPFLITATYAATAISWGAGMQRKLPIANGSFLDAQFQCFAGPSAVSYHGQHRAHC
jgi:hypothetical protein